MTSKGAQGDRTRLVRRGSPEFPAGAPLAGTSFGLPFSPSGARYYTAVSETPPADHTFAIVDDAGPLAIIFCDLTAKEALTRFGSPIELLQRPDLPLTARRQVVRDGLSELQRIARGNGRSEILLRTSCRTDPAGAWAARLLDLGAMPRPSLRAIFDLVDSDEALLEDMSQGHRRHIRWGMKNLALSAVDAANPDRSAFDSFRRLHAEVAGRTTRPAASWEAMFALIAEGSGDLVLSSLDGELMGGTLVLDDEETAYYASGAYRREHMDKPLSHFPLFLAAQRARGRGRRRFDIGETLSGRAEAWSDKERAIARFKAGFSGNCDSSLVWTLTL